MLRLAPCATTAYSRRMTEVAARDLRNDTAGVLRRVQAGEDIVLTVRGAPVARIVPVSSRLAGSMTSDEFVRRLQSSAADPGLAADLPAMGDADTDTVGSW